LLPEKNRKQILFCSSIDINTVNAFEVPHKKYKTYRFFVEIGNIIQVSPFHNVNEVYEKIKTFQLKFIIKSQKILIRMCGSKINFSGD